VKTKRDEGLWTFRAKWKPIIELWKGQNNSRKNMGFLEDNHCFFSELNEELLQRCPPFSCEKDNDIEEFFTKDYKHFAYQLFGKSYGFFTREENPKLVTAFTVSNSMLPVDRFPNDIRKQINKSVPFVKRRVQHPAVLLGQLAVFDGFHGLDIGDEVLDFIKAWFIEPNNKTGCRYLIVDAVNHTKVSAYMTKMCLFCGDKCHICQKCACFLSQALYLLGL